MRHMKSVGRMDEALALIIAGIWIVSAWGGERRDEPRMPPEGAEREARPWLPPAEPERPPLPPMQIGPEGGVHPEFRRDAPFGQEGRREMERGEGARRGDQESVRGFTPLNAIDEARYAVARILLRRNKADEAIAELRQVVLQSPDKDAVAGANLNIARIYRDRVGDVEKAVAAYKEVRGDLAEIAQQEIVELYVETGDTEKAVAELEERLKQAKEPSQKVRVLNIIAELYLRARNDAKAIATLRRIPEVITYEQAERLKAREVEPGPLRGLPGRAQFGPDRLRQEIRELREQGRHEEADRLERRLRGRREQERAPQKQQD